MVWDAEQRSHAAHRLLMIAGQDLDWNASGHHGSDGLRRARSLDVLEMVAAEGVTIGGQGDAGRIVPKRGGRSAELVEFAAHPSFDPDSRMLEQAGERDCRHRPAAPFCGNRL
jgi:hypothetical protein